MNKFVDISLVSWFLIKETAFWFMIGLIIAGVIHQFVSTSFLQKLLGGRGFRPIIIASGIGVLIPVCSCGIIPVAVALHKKGVKIGPSLALCVSAPGVNPAAIVLALKTLGPSLTIGYVITVIGSAMIVGIVSNMLVEPIRIIGGEKKCGCCNKDLEKNESKTLLDGFKWSFNTLAVELAPALVYGFVVAGIMMVVIPQDTIKTVLGLKGVIAYPLTALVGLFMFVCNVGAIPFVASLISQGALPAIAIVFLITGPATNTGQLFLIHKAFGFKAVLLFLIVVPMLSIIGASIFALLNPEPIATMNLIESSGHGKTLWGVIFVCMLIAALLKNNDNHIH